MIEFNRLAATYTGLELFEAYVSREELQAFEAGEHDIEDVVYQLLIEAEAKGGWSCNRGCYGTLEEDEQHMIDGARHANLVHRLSYSVHAICNTPEAAVMLKLKFS